MNGLFAMAVFMSVCSKLKPLFLFSLVLAVLHGDAQPEMDMLGRDATLHEL